jgi:hypothetical protein
MNQHLLGKMRQLGVAKLGNSRAINCDWRRDLAQFTKAAEKLRNNKRLPNKKIE